MIVVDANVIAYRWLNSPVTDVAQLVRREDPDWHVPFLWRSEVRNIVTKSIRRGGLSVADASHVLARIEAELEGSEHSGHSSEILAVAGRTKLSAYDCEYVSLAAQLGAVLVTEDREILRAAPGIARSMADFLG